MTLAVGTLAASATTASSSPQGPAASDDKIKPKLLNQLESKAEANFWVRFDARADLSKASAIEDWDKRGTAVAQALKQTANASQAAVKNELKQAGVEFQAFWATNAIKVNQGSMELAESLAGRPEVDSLWPSFKVDAPKPIKGQNVHEINSVEWGIANINADDVWDQYGVRGEGIVVASIDSGVQYDHPALVDQYRGNNGDGTFDHNYNWFDAAGNCASAPCDLDGHGTHTMGTMIGDDGAGNQIGVAPKATWIAANGCCPSDAALVASGQWMLEPTDLNGDNPDASKRPNIINNSWGTQVPSTAPFMEDITEDWKASGIFGVFANGNSGEFGCNSSGSPGSRIVNYSVGAYDIDNGIADFSGRGAGQDGEIKPNISAPGVNVRSSVPGNGYQSASGTSMATPHVAGTVALLWAGAPALFGDVDATRALLDDTATDHPDDQCGGTDDDNNVFGEGQLDALALMDAAPTGDTGTLAGTVTDSATGEPISGAELTITGTGDRSATTGDDGTYSLVVPAGDVHIAVHVFGYADQSADVTVTAEQTTTRDFALDALPRAQVNGVVTDGGGHGWPMYARITLDGVPGAFYTNPVNGQYSISVPAGRTYQLTATPLYPDYQTVTEQVEVGAGDVTHDIAIPVETSCTAQGYEFSPINRTYEQDFNSGALPDGWTVGDNVGNGQVWTFDDPGGRGNLTGGDGGFAIVDSDEYGSGNSQDTTLVSPSLDLSDVPSPVLGFNEDYRSFSSDQEVEVDLSVDGGATWETVLSHPRTSVRGQQTIVSIPQAGGESDVQVRWHYASSFGWWWQVDDMFVGNRTCDPVNAGLVVGNVTDANTDAGLNGATVTNEGSGQGVMTEATPDDPNLGDGFYWMVSTATGSQSFTASLDQYVTDTADVDVAADAATPADFVLDAGLITTDQTSLDATLEMNGTASRTFTVTNEGTAPAEVTLGTGGGGFEMLGGGTSQASTLRHTDDLAAAADEAQASEPATSSIDKDAQGPSWTAANHAAPKPGKSVTPALPKTPADEVTITHSVSQEIVQGNSVSCNSLAGNAENGFLRTFNLEDFDITGDFNVKSVSFGIESATVTQPMTVKLYTLDGEFVYDNMTLIGSAETTLNPQDLTIVSVPVEGTAPAGSTLVVELDSPNLQSIGGFFFPGSNSAGQTAPSYLRSESCGLPEPTPTDEVGFPDMHLVMNVTGETGPGVPWLTVAPETLSLDPGESAQVSVGLDATVDQPGAYTGRINLSEDTPYETEPVNVTMNVTPPTTWGKVTGVVSGQACDGSTGPLEDATVQIDGGTGGVTLLTDDNGRYAYWLDARGNPYSLIAAKDGYAPAGGNVKITRGKTLTRSFTLQETGC